MCSECPQIPIQIELGEHGLYYGTSTAVKGLLVIGDSVEQVMQRVPQAICEMRAVGADHSKNVILRERLCGPKT
jgi:hypothetical protein